MSSPQTLKKKIIFFQHLHEYSNAEMANILFMSERTYQRKLASPGSFTVSDLSKLEKKFGVEFINGKGILKECM